MTSPAEDSESSAPDITLLLQRVAGGDTQAADRILPLVYDELRKLAAVRHGGAWEKVSADADHQLIMVRSASR